MLQKDKVSVRPMTSEDIKSVAEIENECFSMPWSEQAFKEELVFEGAYTFVAEYDSKVVGFINGRLVIDGFFINNIAVTESARQNNIGFMLIEYTHSVIKDRVLFSTLEVRTSNNPAIRLYTKSGYERIGVRRNFYEKPTEDAVIMTKYFKR